MNYFFLLKKPLENLSTEIDIVNVSPSATFSRTKSQKLILHYFYSDGKKWIFKDICSLNKDESITINEDYFDEKLKDKSIFFSLNRNKILTSNIITDEDYHDSKIAWRSNIKIKSLNSSTSYQAEYPGAMVNKKISLVSCSPMIQLKKNIKNFFFLVNLYKEPNFEKFTVQILNSNKEILNDFECFTNTINLIDINKLNIQSQSEMLIFNSKTGGGIPIYFSIDNESRMSLEHTHPPTEYTLHGNRFLFQKIKKNFWQL